MIKKNCNFLRKTQTKSQIGKDVLETAYKLHLQQRAYIVSSINFYRLLKPHVVKLKKLRHKNI